ncbi:disease resistance protein RUN1-like [Macadamia integrifolia]|uniref:disease resistance protein RUN1-like n=1 Tax=Macadamia integrifolia TaxID=60698 RepID=UPI001C52D4E6|nr:disease resistance protein RUN1-like [Macadamia integrifolia]
MMKLLDVTSKDRRIVGIHGLGGVGKTTVARCVYNTVHHGFEGCSFIADVRETFQTRGAVHLQNLLVTNILNLRNPNITSIDQGIDMIKQRLSNKKVLIVLDDVDQNTDLKAIIGKRDWFGFGSRIIITTRDRHILDLLEVDGAYEPNDMDSDQSLKLFSKHAFKMDYPPKNYLELSKDVVKTTGGLPLALEVIGSSLFGRGELAWKDTVKKLAKIPDNAVQKKLRISYDGLSYEEKEIFLDIACFFIGIDKNIACYIWDGCGFFPGDGIDKLCLNALVKIDENNELRMHDQLRDLGREIVRQENFKEPGERSRLWSHEAALEVLSTRKGTRKVEGLCVTFLEWGNSQCIKREGFDAMTTLRLLQLDYAEVAGNFVLSFPELRWLSWKRCPTQFTLTNLRRLCVLDLSESDITENWMGWNYIKEAETLKFLNLSHCNQLYRTPDLSGNKQLEVLLLEKCGKLTTIDASIGHLKRLVILNMRGCTSLMHLPTSICELSSLKMLDIRNAIISQLPEALGRLEALTELYVNYSVTRLPSSIRHLRNLKILSSDFEFFNTFHRLLDFYFKGVSHMELEMDLPDLPPSLKYLDVSTCKMRSLPRLSNLTNLEVLHLCDCQKLVEIPTTINALTRLNSLHLKHCPLLQCISHLPSSLKSLSVYNCKNVREISGFSNMRMLVKLFLDHCKRLVKVGSLEGLVSLQQFEIENCHALRKLPKLWGLKNLWHLKFERDGLSEIEGLEGLYSLECLIIKRCQLLRRIPNLSDSKNLVDIQIQYCYELFEIGGLKGLDSLETLSVSYCPSLRKIQLPKKLYELEIFECGKLSKIEGLEDLESLTRFLLHSCESIIRLPDLSNLKTLKDLSICDLPLKNLYFEGLESLKNLSLYGSKSLEVLQYVSLLNNPKCLLPYGCEKLAKIQSVGRLESLEVLNVESCKKMKILADISNLTKLQALYIKHCEKLTEIQGVDRLEILKVLCMDGCISIETLPSLSKLKKLMILSAVDCEKLTKIQGVDELESLEELDFRGCISIETLSSLSKSKNLRTLSVVNCKKLTKIQGVDKLESLESFDVSGCITIETLPYLSNLTKLRILSAVDCKKLTEIQGVDELESLESFDVSGCISIETLPCLSNLKKLRILSVVNCKKLTGIQGVDELESLQDFNVDGCISMENFPCPKLKKDETPNCAIC